MSLLSPSLEAFWAVAHRGTVQDAANLIGLTQTGVTQRIRSLEKQLGVTLFLRSRSGMKLTGDGTELLRFTQMSLEYEGMTLAKIRKSARSSIIEVGISGPSSLLRSRVIPHLTSPILLSKFPALRFNFIACSESQALSDLKAGKVHFAILEKSQLVAEIEIQSLCSIDFSLFHRHGLKTADLAKKDLPHASDQSFISLAGQTSIEDEVLKKNGLRDFFSNNRHRVSDLSSLDRMLSIDGALAVLDSQTIHSKLLSTGLRALKNSKIIRKNYVLAWYHRPYPPDFFTEILKRL